MMIFLILAPYGVFAVLMLVIALVLTMIYSRLLGDSN